MSNPYSKKWRRKNPEKWCAQKARNYDKGGVGAINSHKKWEQFDDQLILDHHVTDRTIAIIIKRTVRAIQKRRCLLKKGIVATGGLKIQTVKQ